jgi:hypothetical protein
LIGHLFSERMRISLGEEWPNYTRQWIAFFQHKTWCRIPEPRVQRLWAELGEAHGEAFTGLWEDVQRQGVPSMDECLDEVMVVRHPEPGGICRYLIVHPVLRGTSRGELYLYVPTCVEYQVW